MEPRHDAALRLSRERGMHGRTPVAATLRSLRDVAGPCADDVRDQLAEEYLGWWGFCDWDRRVVPPLTGVADPKRGPYDVA